MGILPDSSDESETERDGFLSTRREIHAAGIGLYDGMRTWRTRPREMPDNEDAQAEPHYYKGAYVAGTILQAVLTVVVIWTLIP